MSDLEKDSVTAKQEEMQSELSDAQQLAALDRRVAIEIFGWRPDAKNEGRWIPPGKAQLKYGYYTAKPPSPSTKIEDAWLVVSEIYNRTYGKVRITGSHFHGWEASFSWDEDITHGSSPATPCKEWAMTPELAICLAALKAHESSATPPTPSSQP